MAPIRAPQIAKDDSHAEMCGRIVPRHKERIPPQATSTAEPPKKPNNDDDVEDPASLQERHNEEQLDEPPPQDVCHRRRRRPFPQRIETTPGAHPIRGPDYNNEEEEDEIGTIHYSLNPTTNMTPPAQDPSTLLEAYPVRETSKWFRILGGLTCLALFAMVAGLAIAAILDWGSFGGSSSSPTGYLPITSSTLAPSSSSRNTLSPSSSLSTMAPSVRMSTVEPTTMMSILYETFKLVPNDGAALDRFGIAVAINVNDDTMAVGSYWDNSGSVYMFIRSSNSTTTSWTQHVKLTAADAAAEEFGRSVAIHGNTLVVGAPGTNSATGSAYVFVRGPTSSSWSQQAKLTASDGQELDAFGISVALSLDTILVGAYARLGSGNGSVYVFYRDDDSKWSLQAKLTSNQVNDKFGASVAIDVDTAVVGAYGDDNHAGSAYMFLRNSSSNWNQQAKLTAQDTTQGDLFGTGVAIANNTVVVGAHWDDSATGSAYVFVQMNSSWTQEAKLVPIDADAGAWFGNPVAIAQDTTTIVVGSVYDTVSGYTKRGSAYIFSRTTTGSFWVQQAKLLASDGASFDVLGGSVAIGNRTVVVGAYRDDDAGTESGSAYMFELTY